MVRRATKAEREHMGKVAALGCVVCRNLSGLVTPAQVHHVRTGVGLGRRASHFDTIPLCPHHHTGAIGIHGLGRKGFEAHYGFSERDLLEQVRREVGA